MKKYLFFLAMTFALSSCAPTYKNIIISQNEAATITSSISAIDFQDADSIPILENYEITNFIENLDSLSYYLRVTDKDCYDFTYDTDSFNLKIRDISITKNTPFYWAIPNSLNWEFPQKIIDISGQGNFYLHRNSKTLIIYKTKSNYITPDEKVDVTVLFGHDSITSRVKHPFAFKRVGATMEVLPSFGFSQINGDASDYMKGAGFMNWGFSVVLNKIRLTPRLAIFEGKLTKNIDEVQEYANFSNTNIELGIGYELLNRTYFNFTPNIFGGRNRLEFYSEDESIENKFVNGGFNYSIGASLELKINPLFRKQEKRQTLKDQYFYFKIDAGWYPNYFQNSMSIDGSVNYLTFAVGWYLAGDNNIRKVRLKN